MTFPLVRLVDAPDPSATVRYDFSDAGALAPRRVRADSFTLGAPSLDSAVDAVSPLYGPRSLGFDHQIEGLEADADAALAVISRELLRPSNWLLIQRTAFSRPTWWRLYATGPGALSWDRVYVDTSSGDPGSLPSTWVLPVTLTAENFGYGERITLGPYTVTQNITATHPMRVTLPTIHGDAPTALRVALTNGAVASFEGSEILLGCTSGTADLAVETFDIGTGDGLSTVTGTSGPNPDAAYMGGEYRTVTVAPDDGGSGSSIAKRLSGFTLPLWGRYKVQVRCEADTAADLTTYLFRLGTSGPLIPWEVGQDGFGATTAQGWVDLGEATFPAGLDVPPDVVATPHDAPFELWVGTGGNVAGEVRLDAIQFIPIGGRAVESASLALTKFVADFAPDHSAVWDGDTETVWLVSDLGEFVDAHAEVSGGFAVANPASDQNVLVVVGTRMNGLAADSTDYLTGTGAISTVTPSYHPRLLHLDGRP